MKISVAVVACALSVAAGSASAVVFTGSSGSHAGSVEFTMSGTSLIVRLTNTSSADVLVPVDVMTGVFWDVSGSGVSLGRTSAVLGAGSTVVFGGTDPGNVVGGEWGYKSGLSGGPGGRDYGISSAGLGLFGPGDVFPGTNLQGPTTPDGLQYGIVSAGDNSATGNTPVTGTNALIKNQVVFTLSGLPSNFDLGRIHKVWFQYGTKLDEGGYEGNVPTPGALALLGMGGLLAARRRR